MVTDDVGRIGFHWSLPPGGVSSNLRGSVDRDKIDPVSNLDWQRDFCRRADALGIDSLLLPVGYQRADPMSLAVAFGMATERIRFMVACRPGVISPTHFVQQVNTVSAFTNGRVEINVVSGQSSEELRYYGDFISREERYEYTDEFWTICHALWRREFPVDFEGRYLRVEHARVNQGFVSPDRDRPYIYVGGSSTRARDVAIGQADCLLRLAEPPDRLAPQIQPALEAGIEVGILCSLIVGPTREEARRMGNRLIDQVGEQGREVQRTWRRMTSDSVGFSTIYQISESDEKWLTPYLWSGLVPYYGPPSISLVGGPDEIIEGIAAYREIGVTRFLFQGRPDLESLILFGEEVLPRIRERQERTSSST